MALTDDELATFRRLSSKLVNDQRRLSRLNRYYEGTHRLEQLGLAVPPGLERFTTIVNWPRVTADSVEQRCDVEGFRVGGAAETDDELWRIWQANDLDEESQLAHLDAIVFGRAYLCVGARSPDERDDDTSDDDVPLITAESPFEMTHETDRRTRVVTAALRRVPPDPVTGTRYATLYLPEVTVWLRHDGRGGWVEEDRDVHGIGRPMVEPLLNRPRLRNRDGASELDDVLTLADAACRALTNAQVATEVMAIPQRYAAGMAPKDFVDEKGEPLPAWEVYFGAVWATANKDAKFGQFSAADLKNFETIVNHYANLTSGVSGLPTRFYGQYTTNPPSEGSIVADETRLIMNARRKHRSFGGSHERVMRLAKRLVDGEWNPDLRRMETLWADPETPTRAQTADAVVKLRSGTGSTGPILPLEAAWEELGYTKTRREQLRAMFAAEREAAAAADPVARAAEAFRTVPEPPATPAELTAAADNADPAAAAAELRQPLPAPTA